MNESTMENEEMKIHTESRKKALQELRQIYTKHSYSPTLNLDSSTCNLPEAKGGLYSPVVEDLLMELGEKQLKKSDENSNRDCYRCRHFLNVPQNLSKGCERVSDCMEKFEDDLSFVQAVVWLKSATTFRKDISVEQFHLAFHRQWNNSRDKRKDPECCRRDSASEDQDPDNKNSINPLQTNKGNSISWENLTQNTICPSAIISQSPPRYIGDSIAPSGTLNIRVIPDSEERSSSISDIFKDSLESKDIIQDENSKELLEGNGSFSEKSVELIALPWRSASGSLDNDLLDATIFNGDPSPNDESVRASMSDTRITIERTQLPDSNSLNKNPTAPLNRVDSTTQKDSAYSTYPLSAENYIYENEDIGIFTIQTGDDITPYQRENSSSGTDDSEFPGINAAVKDWISGRDEQPCLFPFKSFSDKDSDEGVCSIKTKHSVCQDACWGNEYSQAIDYLTPVCKGTCEKKRKLECLDEVDCMIVENKGEERKVSSELLRFTMDTLSVDDIAFRSVKVILSVFRDEAMTRQYMRKRWWKGTLEAQALKAILDFCDVFEAENKTNACTQEIVQAVTDTLDKCMGDTELKKVTISTHQVFIALELCASMPVCIEVINYLTAKLKSQGRFLISLVKSKKADIRNIINQLYITFHALSFCLKKYRLVFPPEGNKQFEEEIIPPVTSLWKKQLNFEGVIVEDSVQAREQRWLTILVDFTVIATDNFPQLAEKSRRLDNILTCKQLT